MKPAVFSFPFLLIGLFLFLKLSFPEVYVSMVQDDSILEDLQAVCFFAAAFLALAGSRLFLARKLVLESILFGTLAAALLFVTGEEISWGQRVFHVASPEYFEVNNTQQETTLHNLKFVQSKLRYALLLVGAYGAFSWLLKKTLLSRTVPRYRYAVNAVIPDWFLSPYFLFLFLFHLASLCFVVGHPGSFLIWRDQEPAELLLSLGFLLLTWQTCRQLRRGPASRASD